MDRKILLFLGLSVLMIVTGLPVMLKQNWEQFSNMSRPRHLLTDTIHNVVAFDGDNRNLHLQQAIADSTRIMFRFPPNTCSCLEADFSEAISHVRNSIGDNRVFVVIAANEPKDIYYFRERTRLDCAVYGTADTLLPMMDTKRMPYVCVVYPDMTARNIMSVYPNNIKEMISYVKKAID